MKKYHLHTTLLSKHWELLNKYTEKFGTQQKVLEMALESVEKQLELKTNPALSQEDEMRMRIVSELKYGCILPRDGLKDLFEIANHERLLELADNPKWLVTSIEFYYKKPFKELSLKEIMDGCKLSARMANWFDSVDYTDDGDHYSLMLSHRLSLNGSEFNKIFIESMFKEYGVKTESEISETNIFIKIYKNQH